MHAARLSASPRLQRVLRVLRDGRAHSTLELVMGAQVMAVSACIAELRAHGAVIHCEQRASERGERRWFYTMTKEPDQA